MSTSTMDYLDTRKEFRHRIILMTGYVCVAIAIAIATLVLLYQAYGFGLGKNGTVIQNGLTFFSSQPSPANIYIDGVLNKAHTNSRVVLPSGVYSVKLTRTGYRPWERRIEVDGGNVHHFDYPFLVPSKLTTQSVASLSTKPGLVTQSPDRRWLLVQTGSSLTDFSLYDLKNPTKAAINIDLPSGLLTNGSGSESWQLEEWADDNQHVVLQHLYDNKSEFILVDRNQPAQSLNLDTSLSSTPTKLTLIDKKYDQYHLYDATTQTLSKATLKEPAAVILEEHTLAYKSYGNDTVLFATTTGAPAGKVLVKLVNGATTYDVRTLSTADTYLIDLTKYSGTLYVVAGTSTDNKAYIYRDPIGQLAALPHQALVPSQVLHVPNPNYLSFSSSTQFVALENGSQFAVYDLENKQGYNFVLQMPIDSPATHTTWMDGNRLTYISGGKLEMVDYDNKNLQTLSTADATYLPFFAPNYKYVYTVVPSATSPSQYTVSQTALLTAADL